MYERQDTMSTSVVVRLGAARCASRAAGLKVDARPVYNKLILYDFDCTQVSLLIWLH
jgi:hypothetical protein